MQLKQLIRDRGHLENIRKCPCIKCGTMDRIQAAHIRFNSDGGIAQKPSDDRVLPLCYDCHARQHKQGEFTFWGGFERVINAIELALSLHPLGLFEMRQKILRKRKDLM